MRSQRDTEDQCEVSRAVKMLHHTAAAPQVPNGDPGKLQRAARRATKIERKGHRKYWASGY